MAERSAFFRGYRIAAVWVSAISLLAAICAQLFPARQDTDAVLLPSLSSFLPAEVVGWQVEDFPLGATEAEAAFVREALQYDDAILRRYSRGTTQVDVHVVYWRPESNKHESNRAHPPDACWPAAGWTLADREFERVVWAGNWRSAPAQYRTFVSRDKKVEMLFWDLRCGTLSGVLMGPQDRWRARFPYLLARFGAGFPGGSYGDETFIRITTNMTLPELLTSDLMLVLARTLAPTGAFSWKQT